MDTALRAGVAMYNAGEYHAAHDAWEEEWLDLARGTDDERFLHGLIQFTAAIYHARRSNWDGATGLAESAGVYLRELPDDYRGVNLGTVRTVLSRLDADPASIERIRPPALTIDGVAPTVDDLDFEAAARVALVLAEEYDAYEESVVERGVSAAREEIAEGIQTTYTTLVMDFTADAERRELVYQRLSEHVERRRHRESDVDGLFD